MKKLSGYTDGKPKVLFLGYDEEQTRIINILISDKCEVWHSDDKITDTYYFDIAISFGYQYIISRDILRNKDCPIVNLHLGYLPYNRGSNPNFWSFYESTPSGITIHMIDSGIDTGDIICRKQIAFDKGEKTFRQTYGRLRNEIEILFVDWKDSIISKEFTTFPQETEFGTYHRDADLPKEFVGWDADIQCEIARLHKLVGS